MGVDDVLSLMMVVVLLFSPLSIEFYFFSTGDLSVASIDYVLVYGVFRKDRVIPRELGYAWWLELWEVSILVATFASPHPYGLSFLIGSCALAKD